MRRMRVKDSRGPLMSFTYKNFKQKCNCETVYAHSPVGASVQGLTCAYIHTHHSKGTSIRAGRSNLHVVQPVFKNVEQLRVKACQTIEESGSILPQENFVNYNLRNWLLRPVTLSNSCITGARDVWHLLHQSPSNKCHVSQVHVI